MWSKNMLCIISVLCNFVRYVIWPKMHSVLRNVPCEFKKNFNSDFVEWGICKMSVNSVGG